MAWTLQQAYNLDKELALTTAVTNWQKLDASMKKHCQAILEGAITETHASFVGKGVTDKQLIEFANNYPSGKYNGTLRPSLIHNERWPADPYGNMTDGALNLIALEAIWPTCNKIGTGVI
jgi:hypothetical protein